MNSLAINAVLVFIAVALLAFLPASPFTIPLDILAAILSLLLVWQSLNNKRSLNRLLEHMRKTLSNLSIVHVQDEPIRQPEYQKLNDYFLAMHDQYQQCVTQKHAQDLENAKLTEDKNNFICQMASAIDEERRRITADLHDHFNQTIINVKMRMDDVIDGVNRDETATLSPGDQEDLDKAYQLLNNIYEDTRQLIHSIYPESLDSIGLKDSLLELVKQYAKTTTVNCQINDAVNAVSKSTALTIFRIVQESLNNIAKYAKATEVSVLVTGKQIGLEHFIIIEIHDNGIGFDVEQVTKTSGIKTMHYRAEEKLGQLQIKSEKGKGTTVEALIPADITE